MGKPADRDSHYMKKMWGTTKLTSDYSAFSKKSDKETQKTENLVEKGHDFHSQNEIHAKIRNDDDYDDWEYGTEPIYNVKKTDK